MGLGIDEVDVLTHPARVGDVVQALQRLLSVWAARAAHHDEAIRLAPRLEQLGQGLDGHVRALEGLDAADEEEEPPTERQAERAPRLRTVPRAEERVVDARRHDTNAARFTAVERRNLFGLDAARGQDCVRTLDDGRLGLGTPVWHVGLDLFGHRLRLDPIEGVEGAYERQVQLVLDHVARQPREPVVGVHRGIGQVRAPLGRPAALGT